MNLKRISLAEANAFVIANHRHHDAAVGHKFSLAAYMDDRLAGVAIVGRPTGRYLDDGKTLEVTRLCTDGTRNACSFLYAACAREAKRQGYTRIITFVLASEPGTSLKAAGWQLECNRCGKPRWNAQRYAHRPEQLTMFAKKQTPAEYKQRWVKNLNDGESRQHMSATKTTNFESEENKMEKQYYIVRGDRSGVFFGQIAERDGREVTMANVRRLWAWQGATECIQLAAEGVKIPDRCRFTMAADELTILDAIEIHPCSAAACYNLREVPIWKQ